MLSSVHVPFHLSLPVLILAGMQGEAYFSSNLEWKKQVQRGLLMWSRGLYTCVRGRTGNRSGPQASALITL